MSSGDRAMRGMRRPTRDEIAAAVGRRVPDLIAPDLGILFCGINPSLYSAAVRHHFARPGNRFWKALHGAGLTRRLLAPWEEDALLTCGCGITNLVARATAGADEIAATELIAGRRRLAAKVRRFRPRWVAVLGLGAYRTAFAAPDAKMGCQPLRIGPAGVWLLPNPSGLNAHHQLGDLIAAFRELRRAPVSRRPWSPR